MIPASRRDSLNTYTQCFAGISLGNEHFCREKFTALVQWICQQFKRCIILIPDSVYAVSLQVSQGLNPENAHTKAMQLTEDFLTEHRPMFQRSDCEFTIVRSATLVDSTAYQTYEAALFSLFHNNGKFNAAIHAFVDTYLSRQSKLTDKDPDHWQRIIELSCEFILAELAVVACIIDRGYCVSVYPGSIDLFHDISAGEHPELPACLMQLINVGIRFRRRGASAEPLPSSESPAETAVADL